MTTWEQRQYNLVYKRRDAQNRLEAARSAGKASSQSNHGWTPIKRTDLPLDKYLEQIRQGLITERTF